MRLHAGDKESTSADGHYIEAFTMVCTRSGTLSLMYEKGVRLQRKLHYMGLLQGPIGETTFYFGGYCPNLLTEDTRTMRALNPIAILFRRGLVECRQIVLIGCLHSLESVCPSCDVDPNADNKVHEVFARQRCRLVCRLWNRDPYVNGTGLIHERAE